MRLSVVIISARRVNRQIRGQGAASPLLELWKSEDRCPAAEGEGMLIMRNSENGERRKQPNSELEGSERQPRLFSLNHSVSEKSKTDPMPPAKRSIYRSRVHLRVRPYSTGLIFQSWVYLISFKIYLELRDVSIELISQQ